METGTILEVYYEGEEITDKISEGYEVPKGSTLEFIVSERGGGTVPLPDLVCLKFSEAEFIIKSNDLSLGSIIPDATIRDQKTAYVWKQAPKYSNSTMLKLGSQIDVYITQNVPENCLSKVKTDSKKLPPKRISPEGKRRFLNVF